MRKLLSIALSGLMAVSIVGCRASAEVEGDDHDHDRSHSSYKKTTTYDNDNDRTVKTEVKTERR